MHSLEYFALEGNQGGNPITYRGVKDPQNLAAIYPHRVGLFWSFDPMNAGLAPPELNEIQNDFEDAVDVLEQQDLGILALVVFGNGMKEWHWYVKDINEWMGAFNMELQNHPQYPLQIEHSEGDGWQYHAAFIEWAQVT